MSRWIPALAIVITLSLLVGGCVDPGAKSGEGAKRNGRAQVPTGGGATPGLAASEFGDRVQIYDKDGLTPLQLPKFPSPLNVTTSTVMGGSGVGCGEPTGGVTWKNDFIWQVCLQRVYVSKDHGATWSLASTQLSSPTTLDPYMWVDTNTDRVYSLQLYVACSYLAYSDDYAQSWIVNPLACGIPVNDHQTMAGGPPASPLVATPVYKDFLYYCVNQIADTMCSRSIDGGLTWQGQPAEVTAYDVEAARQCSAINGHVTVAKDGTVYVPKRECNRPVVMVSTTNAATWNEVTVSKSHAVVQSLAHDPTVATDAASNAFYFWTGDDGILRMSVSKNKGAAWSTPVRASPPGMTMSLFETSVAGDPGRVAVAYYGTNQPRDSADASKKWAYAGTAPNETVWNLYLTFSDNALSDNPTFTTVQVNPSDDPIQRGCVWLSGGSSNCRNLLDFFDINLGKDGRVYIAYADGCVDKCVTWKAGDGAIPHSSRGTTAIVQSGPSLFEAQNWLTPFDAAPKTS